MREHLSHLQRLAPTLQQVDLPAPPLLLPHAQVGGYRAWDEEQQLVQALPGRLLLRKMRRQ